MSFEQRLVQELHQLLMSFNQQDLWCNKCRRAASSMLAPHCMFWLAEELKMCSGHAVAEKEEEAGAPAVAT
ncbi:hypothetical protein T484DRAFT_1860257 [Baffinella frigidus]|nr:hypothetical protein T484DRAFT_1860257 [Cryptophyta sp. CCMP2293]